MGDPTMISDQTRTFIDGIAEPVVKAELLHALATLEGIKAGATGDLRSTEFSRAFDKSVEGYHGAITNQHASIDRLLKERRESIRSIHTLNQTLDERGNKILELAAEVALLTKQTNDLRSQLDTEKRWRETRGQLPADEERAIRQLLAYNADAGIKIRNLEREVERLKGQIIELEGGRVVPDWNAT